MRILFLGNNWVGWQVVSWLKEQMGEIVGLVVHPPHRARYRDKIIESAGVDPEFIFDGSKLRQSDIITKVRELKPDIGVSALFGYILRPEFLRLFGSGCINIHPALLPYNRGAHSNVWSIVDETPAGVTIHYIDEGVDTGKVIAQERVQIEPVDTGETLYWKLELACVELFKKTWPLIYSGRATSVVQNPGKGTYHRVRDMENIDEIDLNRTYAAAELINILRSRTFPPYPGAYFLHEGKKVYLRLQLLYEDELDTESG